MWTYFSSAKVSACELLSISSSSMSLSHLPLEGGMPPIMLSTERSKPPPVSCRAALAVFDYLAAAFSLTFCSREPIRVIGVLWFTICCMVLTGSPRCLLSLLSHGSVPWPALIAVGGALVTEVLLELDVAVAVTVAIPLLLLLLAPLAAIAACCCCGSAPPPWYWLGGWGAVPPATLLTSPF